LQPVRLIVRKYSQLSGSAGARSYQVWHSVVVDLPGRGQNLQTGMRLESAPSCGKFQIAEQRHVRAAGSGGRSGAYFKEWQDGKGSTPKRRIDRNYQALDADKKDPDLYISACPVIFRGTSQDIRKNLSAS